ncbi:MAG TPA: hypothetical protein VGH28_09905 [Polyangiaceae bacterium]|jgi:hypothetical protein
MKRIVVMVLLAGCGGASSAGGGAQSAGKHGGKSDDSIAEMASHEGIATLSGDKPQSGNVGAKSLELALVDKDAPINVDGVPKEWTLVPALSVVKGSAENVSFKCGLAYDARQIYFAGDVTGIALRHLRRFTANEDYATLDLAPASGSPVEIAFFAGKPGEMAGVVRIRGRGVPGARIVEAEKENGYTFEAVVPWSAIAPPTVHVGFRGVAQFHDGTRAVIATGNGDTSSPREMPPLPTAPEEALAEEFLAPKNLLGTAPKFELLADLTGDAMKERVAVYDHFLTVVGPGYREGKEFFYRDLGADVVALEARDITGRGKQDLVVRRRFSGSTTREWLDVWTFFGDEPTTVFSHEIGIASGDKHVTNPVHLGRGEIDVSYEPAAGWDATSYAEPTANDTDPILLPWGQVKSETWRFDGKTFVKAREIAQAGKPRAPATTTTVATTTTTRVEPPTPHVQSGGDLSGQLLARYRADRGVTARPKIDLQVQVDGDSRPERVLLIGRDIVVFGPGFKNGSAYAYLTLSQFADAADIEDMTVRDVTGDGAADLVVRGVRRVSAQLPGGHAGAIEMNVTFVYQLKNEVITRIFGIETARSLGSKRVQGLVQMVPGRGSKGFDFDVRPGRAVGWTDRTYPFTQDQPGTGNLEPLLLPWGGIDHLHYAYDGNAFARVP